MLYNVYHDCTLYHSRVSSYVPAALGVVLVHGPARRVDNNTLSTGYPETREKVRLLWIEATSTRTQYLILLIPLPHSAYDDTIKHENNKKETRQRTMLPLAISPYKNIFQLFSCVINNTLNKK